MDDCLRINKPCKFEGVAKSWPAYQSWKFGENAYDYLLGKFGDQQLSVFVDLDGGDEDMVLGNSFKSDKRVLMKYSEFLSKMSQNAQGVALKESDSKTFDKLREDIKNPNFLQDIMDFYKIEIIQGQTFKMAPHYEKEEQLLCSVDGYMTVKLVPHIFR